MADSDVNAPAELSVSVSRVIRAPRERVFEAWLDPELRRKWWLTHHDEGLTTCEIDARVGGRYCMKQIGSCDDSPDADDDYEWIMQGEFTEITPPQRLVFTWDVNHPNEPISNERVTVEFREVEGGTEVSILHEGILSSRLRDGTERGWAELLENQAKVIRRQ